MDFEKITIETQEQLDALIEDKVQERTNKIIQARLEQKERSDRKMFEGYTSPEDLEKLKSEHQTQLDALKASHTKALDDLKAQMEELKAKNASYELDSVKTKVALDAGLPLELKDRLRGTTEEELKKDAEFFASFASQSPAPYVTPTANFDDQADGGNPLMADYLSLSKNLAK